jgi:hypothetical protein
MRFAAFLLITICSIASAQLSNPPGVTPATLGAYMKTSDAASTYLPLAGGTVAGTVKAVSFTSYGGASALTDAGVDAPVVVAGVLNVSGAGTFTQRPTFNGATPWDSGNFTPGNYLTTAGAAATYLPISGGTANGVLGYNAAGSVFRGILLEWSGVSLWKFGSDSAQTGSNNGGGDLHFYAYGDSGAFLGDSASVTRATRVWNFVNSPIVPTPAASDNSQNAASTAFVKTAAQTAAQSAVQAGTGQTVYFPLPYVRNAQIVNNQSIASIVIPRAMTFPANFAGSAGYSDVTPDGSPIFNILQNGTSIGTFSVLHTFNKANFATSGGNPVTFAAGDRLDIVLISGTNTTGAMDGIRITLAATLN